MKTFAKFAALFTSALLFAGSSVFAQNNSQNNTQRMDTQDTSRSHSMEYYNWAKKNVIEDKTADESYEGKWKDSQRDKNNMKGEKTDDGMMNNMSGNKNKMNNNMNSNRNMMDHNMNDSTMQNSKMKMHKNMNDAKDKMNNSMSDTTDKIKNNMNDAKNKMNNSINDTTDKMNNNMNNAKKKMNNNMNNNTKSDTTKY